MSAEIIPFPKTPIPRPKSESTGDQKVIEMFEEMTECARRGEIAFAAIAALGTNGQCYCAWEPEGGDTTQALGTISFLSSSFTSEVVSQSPSSDTPPDLS